MYILQYAIVGSSVSARSSARRVRVHSPGSHVCTHVQCIARCCCCLFTSLCFCKIRFLSDHASFCGWKIQLCERAHTQLKRIVFRFISLIWSSLKYIHRQLNGFYHRVKLNYAYFSFFFFSFYFSFLFCIFHLTRPVVRLCLLTITECYLKYDCIIIIANFVLATFFFQFGLLLLFVSSI